MLEGSAPAALRLSGVDLPGRRLVQDSPVLLNGAGLRRLFLWPVYVGALYLSEPTRDAAQAIQADQPKLIGMHYLVNTPRGSQLRSYRKKVARSGVPGVSERVEQLCQWLEPVPAGQSVELEYHPALGTTLRVCGQDRGCLPGHDLMRALWTIYLGPSPATEGLKRAMLGG